MVLKRSRTFCTQETEGMMKRKVNKHRIATAEQLEPQICARLEIEKTVEVLADEQRICAQIVPHELVIGNNRDRQREISLRANFSANEPFSLDNLLDELQFTLPAKLF